MYPLYRLREAGWEVDVAALTRRPVQLVVHDFDEGYDAYSEKPGRRLPVDVTFAEVEVERYGALVIPGGRAPEYIRTDPDVRRITEHFFAHDLPVGTICHGPQVPAVYGLLRRPPHRRLPAAGRRHGERGRDVRGRAGRGRRQHGLLPRLAGHAGVVAGVHGRAGPRGGRRVGTSTAALREGRAGILPNRRRCRRLRRRTYRCRLPNATARRDRGDAPPPPHPAQLTFVSRTAPRSTPPRTRSARAAGNRWHSAAPTRPRTPTPAASASRAMTSNSSASSPSDS